MKTVKLAFLVLLTLSACGLGAAEPTATAAPTDTALPAPTDTAAPPTAIPTDTAVPPPPPTATATDLPLPDFSTTVIDNSSHPSAGRLLVVFDAMPPDLDLSELLVTVNTVEFECVGVTGDPDRMACTGRTPPASANVSVKIYVRAGTSLNPTAADILVWEGTLEVPPF